MGIRWLTILMEGCHGNKMAKCFNGGLVNDFNKIDVPFLN